MAAAAQDPVEHFYKPDKDIAPITLKEFDEVNQYLRKRVDMLAPKVIEAIVNDRPNKAPIDKEPLLEREKTMIDDMLRRLIMIDTNRPTGIEKVAEQRPSAFKLMSSAFMYKPEFIKIIRDIIQQQVEGKINPGKAVVQGFNKIVPNAAKIKKAMREGAIAEEAERQRKAKAQAVNLQ